MRFHLLTILVLLVGGVVFADDSLDETAAVAKIELLGGKVTRDETLPGNPVTEIDFRESTKFNEKYLHLLRVFKNLKLLFIEGVILTDTGLTEIGELKQSLPNLKLYYDDPKESPAIKEIEKLGGE